MKNKQHPPIKQTAEILHRRRELLADLVARGMCGKRCGRTATEGKKSCAECRANYRSKGKAAQDKHRKKCVVEKVCRDCGKKLDGKTGRCNDCVAKLAEYHRAQYRRKLVAGLCTRCGNQSEWTRGLCNPCREKYNDYRRVKVNQIESKPRPLPNIGKENAPGGKKLIPIAPTPIWRLPW